MKSNAALEAIYTLGHVQVEGVHVKQIASPTNRFAVRQELQPGHAADGPRRAVRAGNPFGVIKRERPRLHGHYQTRVKDFFRCLGCIDRNLDRWPSLGRQSRHAQKNQLNENHHEAATCSIHQIPLPETMVTTPLAFNNQEKPEIIILPPGERNPRSRFLKPLFSRVCNASS